MNIKKFIDNSLLKPHATEKEIVEFVEKSEKAGFHAVCLPSFWIKRARKLISGELKLCSVIGFPHGNIPKEIKIYEALRVVEDGADEVDMVVNISALKSGYYKYIEEEICAVKRSIKVPLKVIVETCYLTKEEKENILKICIDGGADFIKTSTGFAKEGAKVEDIIMFKKIGRERIKIKAAGGIRRKEEVIKFIEAGADRIGTSRGFDIAQEC